MSKFNMAVSVVLIVLLAKSFGLIDLFTGGSEPAPAVQQQEPAQQQESRAVAVVDVERVLADSRAGKAAKDHTEQARQILQKAFDDLQKEWADAPDAAQRQKILDDNLRLLNQQMQNEEGAARQAALALMAEEVKTWRRKHNAAAVVARQNLLDIDDAYDITEDVIAAMDRREPKFADLPKVEVKKREQVQESQAAKEAPKEEKKEDEGLRVPEPRKPRGRR